MTLAGGDALRRFDLDDLGAHVAEVAPRHRSGPVVGHLDDAHALAAAAASPAWGRARWVSGTPRYWAWALNGRDGPPASHLACSPTTRRRGPARLQRLAVDQVRRARHDDPALPRGGRSPTRSRAPSGVLSLRGRRRRRPGHRGCGGPGPSATRLPCSGPSTTRRSAPGSPAEAAIQPARSWKRGSSIISGLSIMTNSSGLAAIDRK